MSQNNLEPPVSQSAIDRNRDKLLTEESGKKWYVSLGEGTWAALDELPFVFLATPEQIENIEENESLVAGGCQERQEEGAFESHIHIRDLVENSHWDDHTPVVDRPTPDRINS